jgi:hypothetical protein
MLGKVLVRAVGNGAKTDGPGNFVIPKHENARANTGREFFQCFCSSIQ